MNKILIGFLILSMVLLTGCFPETHYEMKEIIYEQAITVSCPNSTHTEEYYVLSMDEIDNRTEQVITLNKRILDGECVLGVIIKGRGEANLVNG